MPRPLVIGNGNLLATLDAELNLRDLYWPFVGLHNHLSGNRARLGLWLDGRFSWLSDHGWERAPIYEPGTLVTAARAANAEMRVTVELAAAVLHDRDVLLRRFRVHNHTEAEREARLFLSHDLHLAETEIADCAFYDPFLDAMVHYKRRDYFLIAAESDLGGLYQYAAGISDFGGSEGAWRDAEDGELSGNAVAQGAVDSVVSVRLKLPPNGFAEARAWICAGRDLEDVARLHASVTAEGFDALQDATRRHWALWSDRVADRLAVLPEPVREQFRRSLLTIRTNVDNRGAIIAANDSDIMETARAHYSYMWPRDGALVAEALDRLGYDDITRRFFAFCRAVLPHDRPVLLHKYSADGTWGSTWHPWVIDGHKEVPFQQDSSNLVLHALWTHYERTGDRDFIAELYAPFIAPCADFLAAFRNPDTGLPLPSWDLWEERRGVHAYTCGTMVGAMEAVANLADLFGDSRAATYRVVADEVRAGMAAHLWDGAAGRFARCLYPARPDGLGPDYTRDLTMDSALHAVWAFGAFPPDDPRVRPTLRAVVSRLWVQTDIGGIARYESDYYFRRSDDVARIPGNPWIICTLWAAQWYIAQARSEAELATALELLLWACRRALPSGILPEQVHPETGQPLSVAPLTWSHAEFVATALDYLDKLDGLRVEG